ncbi:hypothetical protein [Ornithinimicrobium kibberense]|uniref:hypothetical protein n=1 Tax=Ornithinimicrobium kibberense TaxID=282060 RepID=UPI00361DCF78
MRPATGAQADQGRLVDEPGGHDHASRMTSESPRSGRSSASASRSAAVTGAWSRCACSCSRLRRYSVRDSPTRLACSSSRARSSFGKFRIRMSGMVHLR